MAQRSRKENRVRDHVITDINEFRSFMGSVADVYSDTELRQLRNEMYALAELLLDIYAARTKSRGDDTIDF